MVVVAVAAAALDVLVEVYVAEACLLYCFFGKAWALACARLMRSEADHVTRSARLRCVEILISISLTEPPLTFR